MVGFVLPFAVIVVYGQKNGKDSVFTSELDGGNLVKLSYGICLLAQLLFFAVELIQLNLVGKHYL